MAAKVLFRWSILYLFGICLLLLMPAYRMPTCSASRAGTGLGGCLPVPAVQRSERQGWALSCECCSLSRLI